MGKNGNIKTVNQKNKKSGLVPTKNKNSESIIRMNFLHKAAACILQTSGNPVLAAALTHHSLIVGQKGLIRPHRDVKRKICKGCHGLLVPGQTSTVSLAGPSKQKKIGIVCQLCTTKKCFLLEENKNKQKKQLAIQKKKKEKK